MNTDSGIESEDLPRSRPRGRSAWEYGEALVTAVQFLTRIPLPSAASPDSLRRAPMFFPLVGLAIGGFTAGLLWLTGLIWPVWVAVLLSLAVELRLTGALHEDGLADFCDAFGGGWTRGKVLEILKDSCIGTYGMLGLAFGVGLRISALVAIVSEYGQERWLYWVAALVTGAAVGRWMMVVSMAVVPPVAQRESLSRDVSGSVSWRYVAAGGFGTIPAVVPFVYLMPMNALLAVGLVVSALAMLCSLIRRKLGGMTGDCLGCIGYVSQVLVLVAAAARFE